jgi:hypothetical protein
MAKAKTKKRLKGSNTKLVERSDSQVGSMQLGNRTDMARRKALSIVELRPDYKSARNVYAFVGDHPKYDPRVVNVPEHWAKVDGKPMRIVCGVMAVPKSDPEWYKKRENRYGYPEGCNLCKIAKDLFSKYKEGGKKSCKDSLLIRGFDLAKEIASRRVYYLEVIKGDLVRVKEKNKVHMEPIFDEEALIVHRLKISDHAYDILFKAVEEAKYTGADLWGMPFNLVGGKSQGSTYVIDRIDFFDEYKLKKLPENRVDFSVLEVCDLDQINKVAGIWKEVIPDILAGRNKKRSRSSTVKSRVKSGSKTRRKVVR